jgi:cystathionine gamma-synthase
MLNAMTQPPTYRPETLAVQGLSSDPDGGVAPPIQPSTTYRRDASDYALVGETGYSRGHNPTSQAAETSLAALEGGAAALLFASGMAAATAVLQTLAPGDHIVAQRTMYWGLRDWLLAFCDNWGLGLDLVEAGDPAALAEAIAPGRTKLVWIETPANPTWQIVDIAAAAELAHAAGARLVVDSTTATPVLTRPLALGADLVMHSATKYLNGHSDVVAGVLVTARADGHWQRLHAIRTDGGAVLGPFEAWLLQRGLRTLFLRVRQASATALRIAEHFQGHPGLAAVLYPGLTSHPGHALAARQMDGGFGGMLSLRVAGGAASALAVVKACRLFHRATSLGGVESLIEHRATIEGATSPIPADLLRLSIGLEHPDDLIADLEQALAAAG